MLLLLSLVAYLVNASGEVDPCQCLNDNSAIPKSQKKFSGTDYGKSCEAWDMEHRYCKNPKSIQQANRACWCPKKWCYVAKECQTAKLSQFFRNAELYYSYLTCGDDESVCFKDDDGEEMPDEEGQIFADALDEENREDGMLEEDTLTDVVEAVVMLTIKVNDMAKVVNSLSSMVSTLNREVVVIAEEAEIDTGIIAPESGPVIIPTENIVITEGQDGVGYTETFWGETGCPVGYKTIGDDKKCQNAGGLLSYQWIGKKGKDLKDMVCIYTKNGQGVRMSKNYGTENEKLICRRASKNE